jgi:hypothetical protein
MRQKNHESRSPRDTCCTCYYKTMRSQQMRHRCFTRDTSCCYYH